MDTFSLAEFQVLAIPDMMYTYAYISKLIAITLIPLLIILNESHSVIEATKGTSSSTPAHGFVRIILIIIGLFTFRHIFLKIVALFEAIAMSLFDTTDWWVFREKLAASGEQFSTSLFKISMQNAIAVSAIMLASIVEIILNVVRFVLLSILYVLGPLALVSGIYIKTARLLGGWFTNLVQISFWIVMLRIVQAVMLSLDVTYTITHGSKSEYIMVSAVLIILIVSIPALTARILSGQNLGLLGSAAVGLAAAGVIKYGTGAARTVVSGTKGAYAGTAGVLAGGKIIARTIKQDGIGKASHRGIKSMGRAIHRKMTEKPRR
ncbi:MAG: hypothetical protein ABIH89_02365 [Elusimicrobiota bacterium]